jgi:hypothetical protein
MQFLRTAFKSFTNWARGVIPRHRKAWKRMLSARSPMDIGTVVTVAGVMIGGTVFCYLLVTTPLGIAMTVMTVWLMSKFPSVLEDIREPTAGPTPAELSPLV